MIGYMAMPADFKYKSIFLKGQPKHQDMDAFRCKHPSMEHGRRAKIFAPFDALKGFQDELSKAQSEVTDNFLGDADSAEDSP